LTGIFPLVELRVGNFMVGLTALKAAPRKMVKHEKVCYDNQHVIIPFVFDNFDFIAPEVVDLLKRVQRVMHINIVSHKSMNVIFQKLIFVHNYLILSYFIYNRGLSFQVFDNC
jgi:hypothetical protein